MAPRIAVITLAIGDDYRNTLKKALNSKREYCKRHGYDYFEFHEERWNRERPIAWSKVPIWQEFCEKAEYDYVWISDADVYITNQEKKLEDWVLPLLPETKDLLVTYDTCGHVNSGNMIVRPCAWSADFWHRVWNQTDVIYHIWWENAAITKLLGANSQDVKHVEVTTEAYRFNAYIQGLPNTRQWLPGDFLVHFAGVYNTSEMAALIDEINTGRIPRKDMWNGQRLEDAKL